MARPKKAGQPVSLIMDQNLFVQVEQYCSETYLTKTAAIEKALKEMLDRYYKEKETH